MEGDDQQDPIADAVRSLLDRHVIHDHNLSWCNLALRNLAWAQPGGATWHGNHYRPVLGAGYS